MAEETVSFPVLLEFSNFGKRFPVETDASGLSKAVELLQTKKSEYIDHVQYVRRTIKAAKRHHSA